MEISFADKVVVITGAAGGFGSATARAFGAAGAHVVVSDINIEAAQKVADALPSAIAVQTDVTDPAAIEELIRTAVDKFGGLDVLVNNAGAPNRAGDLEDLDNDVLNWLTDINYKSTVLASKYALPHLKKREGASIINVASISAKRPRAGHAVYCSTKAGVEAFTRALAVEVAPTVRVNSVSPVVSETGFINSAFGQDKLTAEQRASMVAGIPMGRTADVTDVSKAIMYLASDLASFQTGTCLDVDGGRSIS